MRKDYSDKVGHKSNCNDVYEHIEIPGFGKPFNANGMDHSVKQRLLRHRRISRPRNNWCWWLGGDSIPLRIKCYALDVMELTEGF